MQLCRKHITRKQIKNRGKYIVYIEKSTVLLMGAFLRPLVKQQVFKKKSNSVYKDY